MAEYVSRAGEKLEFALKEFDLSVEGLVCADLGASTGGFTDVMLQAGAKKVYSVEKGYGTVEWKIRQDERVEVMERTNAMHVKLPEKVNFISIDLGWTKLKNILPHALTLLGEKGTIVALLKTHYEADRTELVKGKVPDEHLQPIVGRVVAELKEMDIEVDKIVESPVKGGKGKNTEFLLLITK